MKRLLIGLLLIPLVGCGKDDETPAIKPGTDQPTVAGDQQLNETAARMKAMGQQMQQQHRQTAP